MQIRPTMKVVTDDVLTRITNCGKIHRKNITSHTVDVSKTLTFSVAPLIDQTTGTNERYIFEGPAKFDGIEVKSDIKGTVEFMRIDEGFNVSVQNMEIKVGLNCEKCLKPISQTVKIAHIEKNFLLHEPEKINDLNDLYLVETKHMTIDLTEALRQEIILHFPAVQVCSTGCKGICPKCGTDLNKKKCKCKIETEEDTSHKPLAGLKKLLK
ncbi:MAG: hypothetical protein GWP15_03945 [Nitrospirae bacterium]|nr:hypothetical protein [Nitrospirota bacterium]